ncbi:hypothetical protein BJ878DRAFT_559417 [Calycina marina]|uniref:Uncharacterized protein n=1 Tax=Calycina marina TaxID=1763456 RepID=A0A9P7YW66_9HELO|nr:hypothetical protein BJ878DRAFT_559417 [Calycina marina]
MNVEARGNLVGVAQQSPPVDLSIPYSASWISGKTILITGGASGFGEGFFRKWAANSANVIIGDINDTRGKALVEEVRAETGNNGLHFVHCDVTDWQSQVDFFKAGVQLSPHGGIDAVVANAGMVDVNPGDFHNPEGLNADEPPKQDLQNLGLYQNVRYRRRVERFLKAYGMRALNIHSGSLAGFLISTDSYLKIWLTRRRPNLRAFEVNLIGVLYTTHLAYFYLPRNPRPQNKKPNSSAAPSANSPDRHLLLIGSLASISALPVLTQYSVSKHGVLGLFRSLRATSMNKGIRINILLPYFVETPLIGTFGRLLLAGGATGKPEDVVDAGTRFMADSRIIGRALAVGPKFAPDKDRDLLATGEGQETAIYEVHLHDLDETDAFVSRFTRLVNNVEIARGWVGWAGDVMKAFALPLGNWWRGGEPR